ncbi:MAG: hypothetical protein ACRCT2_02360, partial [Plesiomonas shigelloides]
MKRRFEDEGYLRSEVMEIELQIDHLTYTSKYPGGCKAFAEQYATLVETLLVIDEHRKYAPMYPDQLRIDKLVAKFHTDAVVHTMVYGIAKNCKEGTGLREFVREIADYYKARTISASHTTPSRALLSHIDPPTHLPHPDDDSSQSEIDMIAAYMTKTFTPQGISDMLRTNRIPDDVFRMIRRISPAAAAQFTLDRAAFNKIKLPPRPSTDNGGTVPGHDQPTLLTSNTGNPVLTPKPNTGLGKQYSTTPKVPYQTHAALHGASNMEEIQALIAHTLAQDDPWDDPQMSEDSDNEEVTAHICTRIDDAFSPDAGAPTTNGEDDIIIPDQFVLACSGLGAHVMGTQYYSVGDTGADTMILGNGWRFEDYKAKPVCIRGFHEKHALRRNVYMGTGHAVCHDHNGTPWLVVAANAVDNSGSDISLLSTAQIFHSGNFIDPIPRCYGGQQAIYDPVTASTLPMVLRRSMVSLLHRHPTPEEFATLPRITLTNALDWAPADLNDDTMSTIPFVTNNTFSYQQRALASPIQGLHTLGGGLETEEHDRPVQPDVQPVFIPEELNGQPGIRENQASTTEAVEMTQPDVQPVFIPEEIECDETERSTPSVLSLKSVGERMMTGPTIDNTSDIYDALT